MSKASEDALAQLHAVVAKVLTDQVSHKAEETTFDKDGLEVGTGEFVYTATPATVAAAIKFLKDNQITCDIEVDENMNNLRDALSKKQRHSRLTSASDAAKSTH